MNDVKSVIHRLLYNDRISKSNKQYCGLFEVWWSEEYQEYGDEYGVKYGVKYDDEYDESTFLALSCKYPFVKKSCNYRRYVEKNNNNIYSLYSGHCVVGILPNKYI